MFVYEFGKAGKFYRSPYIRFRKEHQRGRNKTGYGRSSVQKTPC